MKEKLPQVDEVIAALGERCLGEGQEVKVYKIDTNPDFTVQVSHDAPAAFGLAEISADISVRTAKRRF